MLVVLMGVLDIIAGAGLWYMGAQGWLFYVAVLAIIKGAYSLMLSLR